MNGISNTIDMSNNFRVLIVEDDKLQALITEKMVEKLGYIPIGNVDTAEKAISMCKSRYPDIVLMDMKLKGEIDGIEAANEIFKLRDFPLIFITGSDEIETNKRIKQTQYIEVVKKPFNNEILSNALSKCFIT